MSVSKNQKINLIYQRQERLLFLMGEVYDMVNEQHTTHVAALEILNEQLQDMQKDLDIWGDPNIKGAARETKKG